MSERPGPIDGARPDDDCSTTASFADHGIEDGSDLVRETYYRLSAGGVPAFEPTGAFFHRLADAFRWAYLGSVTEAGIPPHVDLAVEDARELTLEEFRDDPDADLRTEVLPAFYARVAGFHCVYRD
jgi:hypothetical protein